MFYRALKSVLLLSFALSISSMAAESPVSSSSAQSPNAVQSSNAAQSQSAATLVAQSSSAVSAKPLPKWQTLPEIKAPWMKGERLEYELSS